jgi:hypothetical protein
MPITGESSVQPNIFAPLADLPPDATAVRHQLELHGEFAESRRVEQAAGEAARQEAIESDRTAAARLRAAEHLPALRAAYEDRWRMVERPGNEGYPYRVFDAVDCSHEGVLKATQTLTADTFRQWTPQEILAIRDGVIAVSRVMHHAQRVGEVLESADSHLQQTGRYIFKQFSLATRRMAWFNGRGATAIAAGCNRELARYAPAEPVTPMTPEEQAESAFLQEYDRNTPSVDILFGLERALHRRMVQVGLRKIREALAAEVSAFEAWVAAPNVAAAVEAPPEQPFIENGHRTEETQVVQPEVIPLNVVRPSRATWARVVGGLFVRFSRPSELSQRK